jgi:hypothetical protein
MATMIVKLVFERAFGANCDAIGAVNCVVNDTTFGHKLTHLGALALQDE